MSVKVMMSDLRVMAEFVGVKHMCSWDVIRPQMMLEELLEITKPRAVPYI